MPAKDGSSITRRDFLKYGAGMSSASALIPWLAHLPPPDEALVQPIGVARITTSAIYRYRQASFQSQRIGYAYRNDLVNIYEEIESPHGPAHNPKWYLLADGYIHSGYTQRVEACKPNQETISSIPESGCLGEVCVAHTQSFRWIRSSGWTPLYHLYYQSVHWITGMERGPDGTPCYRLTDDLLHVHHYIPTGHIRPIREDEIRPLSPEVPAEDKHIRISINRQQLEAYEGETRVYQAQIASGVPTKDPQPDELPTDTPIGRFYVQTKMPSRHMGDGELNSDVEAYELPGVPWVCFFTKDGIALHGTYWHDNFGRKMSHGCVNLRNEDARWLYRWTTPVIHPGEWYARDMGTRIDISED